MATLTLVRHAHAEWPQYSGRDFDRPLTSRGEADAAATARAIGAALQRPDQIIASPARRARQTAEIIAAVLALPHSGLQFVDVLYNAPARTLEAELRRALNDVRHVLLVAHNPGISNLARELTGEALRPPLQPAEWLQITAP